MIESTLGNHGLQKSVGKLESEKMEKKTISENTKNFEIKVIL